MLRLTLAVTTSLLALPAFAGGVVVPPPPPVIVPIAPAVQDWTGFYGGVQLDALVGDVDTPTSEAEMRGHLAGIFAGYRYDFGDIVVGAEVDYLIGSLEQEITAGLGAGTTADVDVNYLMRAGVEVGYDLNEMLAYASFGYVDLETTALGTTVSGDGVFAGIGIDYMVSDNVVLGMETNYHWFEDYGGAAGNDFDIVTVGLNLAYRF